MPFQNTEDPLPYRSVGWKQWLTVLLTYLLLGWFGKHAGTINHGTLSMVWLPAGVSLVAFVLYGPRIWPAICLGSLVVNVSFLQEPNGIVPLWRGLLAAAAAAGVNTVVQAWWAQALYHRHVTPGTLWSTHGVATFLLKVALLPSLLNMLLLTLIYGMAGYFDLRDVGSTSSLWLAGAISDYHGYIVAGLFGLVWLGPDQVNEPRLHHATSPRHLLLPLLVFAALLVGVSILWQESAIYLLPSIGVLAAMYRGLRASTAFMLCISFMLTLVTTVQVGPFEHNEPLAAQIMLLVYVVGVGVPVYLVAGHRHDLIRSAQLLEDKVAERTHALHALNAQLQALSSSDPLTGLANRRQLDEVLDHEWRRAAREGNSLAVGMVDVDWFKRYNDALGHAQGDACLQEVARLLSEHVGRAGDMVARYGGEEFVLVLPACDTAAALELAHKIGEALRQRRLPHPDSPLGIVSVSIGVAATRPQVGDPHATLLRAADMAMYRAKSAGRDRACAAPATDGGT
jgi:diguanylate cyclase (GGDEF)-like protein